MKRGPISLNRKLSQNIFTIFHYFLICASEVILRRSLRITIFLSEILHSTLNTSSLETICNILLHQLMSSYCNALLKLCSKRIRQNTIVEAVG